MNHRVAYPTTDSKDDRKGTVLFVCFNAWISKCMGIVNKEAKTIRIEFNGIYIEFIPINHSRTTLFRIIFNSLDKCIVRMYCLISNRIIIQSFHNINLSTIWPFFIFRQQPESRPSSPSSMQPSIDLQTSMFKQFFPLLYTPPVNTGDVSFFWV